MTTTELPLPIAKECKPADAEELARAIAQAAQENMPVYPCGGGTKQHWGLPPQEPGLLLSTAGLNRVVDYPWEDMTITVQPGITVAELQRHLAQHGQHLPVDVPRPEAATLGGAIATNSSGPRRFGYGTLRDYVIGIQAADGQGRIYQGGGRVVKNVAGYDFCKLLIGSWGTVGVVTQVTLKVPPAPQDRAMLLRQLRSWSEAEEVLAELNTHVVQPVAVELLCGSGWKEHLPEDAAPEEQAPVLLVVLEGTREEVPWCAQELACQWEAAGAALVPLDESQQQALWPRLVDFPLERRGPATIQATTLPSRTCELLQELLRRAPQSLVLAHAASGVVVAHLEGLAEADVPPLVLRHLQPLAHDAGGNVVLLGAEPGVERTHQLCWGGWPPGVELMQRVLDQFDPARVLNRGRYVV